MAMSSIDAFIMKSLDNVATVIRDIEIGDKVLATLGDELFTIQATEKIPFGFKIALKTIQKGELIIKYGEVIGKANTVIEAGALVHIHNLDGIRGRGDVEMRRSTS